MVTLKELVAALQSIKASGIPRHEALDCLEFDEYVPCFKLLEQALIEVYGKE